MTGAPLLIKGADFDAGAVPSDVTSLAIYTVRKGDFARLNGLRNLAIKHLELRWISAADFTHIPLPETLETLHVWQSPKLRSCAGITQAPRLGRLKWWDSGTLEDATELTKMAVLKELILASGMNQKQNIADLGFLRDMRLDVLGLDGIGPHDLDVAPILEMKELRQISLHGTDWNIESLALLAARFPAVHADIHALQNYPKNLGMTCKKCAGSKKMLRLRKRKFLWCPVCESKGLEKTLTQFDKLVEAARQSGVQPLPEVTHFEE